MTDSGIAAIHARISAIQTQFAPAPIASPASTTKTGSASFASTLDQALATSSTSTQTSPTAAKVVDIAKQWIGTPYVYGGNDPEKGIDCSGLVQQAFKRVGIDLPRVTYDQVKQGVEVPSIEQAKPGDLIFKVGDRGQRVNGHVGIYLGDGKWIEAPYTGANVRITDVPKELTAIRRVIPDTAVTATPVATAPVAASTAGDDDMSTRELLATLLPLLLANSGGSSSNSALLSALSSTSSGGSA